MYKTIINGVPVWVYSEEEHIKAVEYENLSHKAMNILQKLGGK